MKNLIPGERCQIGPTLVMENGTTGAVYICRMGSGLPSCSSDLIQRAGSVGMTSLTNGFPGPFTQIQDSMNGFVQMLDGYQTQVYIRFLQSDRSCGL